MTEEHATYRTGRNGLDAADGVQPIADLLQQWIQRHGWKPLPQPSTNGQPAGTTDDLGCHDG